jgi:hypothetical protein
MVPSQALCFAPKCGNRVRVEKRPAALSVAGQVERLDSSKCRTVVASMYPASDWSMSCSRPLWRSARVRRHERLGLERAIRVTSVRMRREDRSSISSSPLADLGGVKRMRLRAFCRHPSRF